MITTQLGIPIQLRSNQGTSASNSTPTIVALQCLVVAVSNTIPHRWDLTINFYSYYLPLYEYFPIPGSIWIWEGTQEWCMNNMSNPNLTIWSTSMHRSPGDWGVEGLKHMYHRQDPRSRRKAWWWSAWRRGWVGLTSPAESHQVSPSHDRKPLIMKLTAFLRATVSILIRAWGVS